MYVERTIQVNFWNSKWPSTGIAFW
jgi:hypothetical protein